jgi:hypothetical protein
LGQREAGFCHKGTETRRPEDGETANAHELTRIRFELSGSVVLSASPKPAINEPPDACAQLPRPRGEGWGEGERLSLSSAPDTAGTTSDAAGKGYSRCPPRCAREWARRHRRQRSPRSTNLPTLPHNSLAPGERVGEGERLSLSSAPDTAGTTPDVAGTTSDVARTTSDVAAIAADKS